MPERRPRRTYTDEFKMQLVQLHQNGKKKSDIVREYDLTNIDINVTRTKQKPYN